MISVHISLAVVAKNGALSFFLFYCNVSTVLRTLEADLKTTRKLVSDRLTHKRIWTKATATAFCLILISLELAEVRIFCNHPTQDAPYLILLCPAKDSLRRSLFGDSLSATCGFRPFGVVWVLEVHALRLSKRIG